MMTAASVVARALTFGPVRPRRHWMPIPATATDAELVSAARGGNGEAIAHLVERYSRRLGRYLVRLVGEPALAEDVLQETWLRVVERLDRYDQARPFAVWLFAVARHCAIDAFRRRARQGHRVEPWYTEEGELVDPVEQVPGQAVSVLEQLAEQEVQERVASLFATLPGYYREVLTLRFHEGLQLKEIAHVLDLPLSTIKTRAQRGLLLLRQRVEGLRLNENE